MNIAINHKLKKDKALVCAKNLLSELRNNNSSIISNPVQVWTENECNFSFTIKGSVVKGTILVLENEIKIKGKLPITLNLFKGLISETIIKKTNMLLSECSET
ncbi:MAG: polyhydroxyalkanoic acid system family protein [Bacteroidota bacterium]|nr:polyhydroxyalkanoic acid system family protein [Bacteroidota bacterium]